MGAAGLDPGAGPADDRHVRVALLQSVAVLAGVSPVQPRPATAVDRPRADEAIEPASRVGPRGRDALDLSTAALGGRASGRGEGLAGSGPAPAATPVPPPPVRPDGPGGGDGDGDADDASASAAIPASTAAPAAPATPAAAPAPTAEPVPAGPRAGDGDRDGDDGGSARPDGDDASVAAAPAAAGPRGRDGTPLTDGEQRRVQELKARDQEVRTHEEAHKAVGGRYAGAISYEYSEGPDGRRYATGGSVPIDASPVSGDPEATIAKMQVVRAAALAPAEPSPQDRKVAAQADRTAGEARQEIARESMRPPEDDEAAEAATTESPSQRTERTTDAPDAEAADAPDAADARPSGRPDSAPAPTAADPAGVAGDATDAADVADPPDVAPGRVAPSRSDSSGRAADDDMASAAAATAPAPGRLELAAAAYRRALTPAATAAAPGVSGPGTDPAAWAADAVRVPRLDLVG
jgi:hypothetical protein